LRLTRFGLQTALLYAALVFAFLAAPYSNLFFLLLAFLTLLGLTGAWWTLANLRGVTLELAAPEPVPAGRPALLRATLASAGRTSVQLSVAAALAQGARASAGIALLSGTQPVVLQLPALPRGVHPVHGARVSSSYPFGLLEVGRRLATPRELVVYPAPTPLVAARSASEALAEALQTGGHGHAEVQPAGMRDHRRGDELRRVHWRASARRGALVVREWEGGGDGGLELLLDRRCGSEALEQALSLISAVVQLARDHKQVLRLHSQGLQQGFGPGQRPWPEALRFLAEAQPLPADGPAPPVVSPTVPRLPQAVRHVA
jgi:uncharacterized protein (DUF58 family)